MLKNLSALVFEIEGKIYHLLAEVDSPLDHVIQVGQKIVDFAEATKLAIEATQQKIEPKVDDPQEEKPQGE